MKRSIIWMTLGLLLIGCRSSTPTQGPPVLLEGTQSITPTAEPKNWVTATQTNPMDGTQTISLHCPATNKSTGTLTIRFTGKKLDVYIITDEIVDDENTGVRIRLDDGAPIKQVWSRSADYKAVFSPNPFGLLKALQRSSHFYIEYRPYQRIPETIIFDVTGLSSALPPAQKKRYDDISAARAALRARILLHVHPCTQKNNDGSLMFPGQWCWSDPNGVDEFGSASYRADLLPFSTKEEAIKNAIETTQAYNGVLFKK